MGRMTMAQQSQDWMMGKWMMAPGKFAELPFSGKNNVISCGYFLNPTGPPIHAD